MNSKDTPCEVEMKKIVSKLRYKYYCSFPEKLEAISKEIQRLKENPEDRKAIERLYAMVHKMYGTSGSFGFDQIAGFCGDWETKLNELTSELKTTIPASGLDQMYRYLSSLRKLIEADPVSISES